MTDRTQLTALAKPFAQKLVHQCSSRPQIGSQYQPRTNVKVASAATAASAYS